MKKLFLLPLLLLLLPLGNNLRAQAYIGVHGGVTLPNGYYADSKLCDQEWIFLGTSGHQKKAGAGTGWFGGLDIAYNMPFLKELSVVVSADYMQSNFNKDVQKYLNSMEAADAAAHETYETQRPQLCNMPILGGLRFSYPIGVYYDLYGEALFGVNIRTVTDWKNYFLDSDSHSEEVIRQYDEAKTFAFRLGVGVVVRDIVTVGASYTMLGSSQLKWTETTSWVYPQSPSFNNSQVTVFDDEHYSFNPSMVMITLGFRITPFRSMTRNVQDY